MAELVLTFPDDMLPDLVAAFCEAYNYPEALPNPDHETPPPMVPNPRAAEDGEPENIPDPDWTAPPATLPNPQPREEFAAWRVLVYGREVLTGWQAKKAATAVAAAREAVDDKVQTGLAAGDFAAVIR
jgi:hypothetical protein